MAIPKKIPGPPFPPVFASSQTQRAYGQSELEALWVYRFGELTPEQRALIAQSEAAARALQESSSESQDAEESDEPSSGAPS